MGKIAGGIERLFWLLALACASYSGFAWQQAHAVGRQVSTGKPAVHGVALQPGAVMGQLQIPSIGLSVPVLEDDGTGSLLRGIGHIRGTAMPGGLGTVGLAGHRDTFLRPLRNVAPKMEINVSRGAAFYRYIVDRTEIVHPEDVRVLDTQNTPELVLVTCYPFHFVGAAPLRFIVHAHLASLTPEPLKQ